MGPGSPGSMESGPEAAEVDGSDILWLAGARESILGFGWRARVNTKSRLRKMWHE